MSFLSPISNFILHLAGRNSTGLTVRDFTPVETKCPLLVINDNYLTRCKDGSESIVIELTGRDYTGLDKDDLHNFFIARKAFFDQLPSDISCLSQSHRSQIKINLFNATYSNKFSSIIADKWANNFTKSFRTKHYLVLTPSSAKGALAVLQSSADKLTGSHKKKIKEKLENAKIDALNRLSAYGPRVLEGDELASYWARLLNGRIVKHKLAENGKIDGLLSDTRIFFPKNSNHVVYDGLIRKFSSFVSLKLPPEESGYELLNALFSVRRDISLYQTFSTYDKDVALAIAEHRLVNEERFQKSSELSVNQLQGLLKRLQADEIDLLEHRFAIEIFGRSEEELKEAILDVRSVLESQQYRIFLETTNTEALYWSRFPGMQQFNSRSRNITSENSSHFCTFPTVGEGSSKCSFGPYPVQVFKTDQGSDYSFIFHESEAPQALGHTLIIGQPGSGKTVLSSFLQSSCTKFSNFQNMAFDRLNGLEIVTLAHDGEVITAKDLEGLDINPFQLPDTPENRMFLSGWVADLLNVNDENEKDIISISISELFELPKDQRNLSNLAPSFGLMEKGSLGQRLKKWLPGGSNGAFFCSEKDALNFTNPFLTFDMTSMLDRPDVLAPLSSYIFHRIKITDFPGGFLFFLDEAPNYFNHPILAPHIQVALLEWRKKNGVFLFATQTATSIYNSDLREAVKSGVATYILFPDSKAEFKIYNECFGLTHQEFEWIKGVHPRQCMVKRKTGNSVILNVDLACLNNYLGFFDSSEKSVKKVRALRKEYGNEWKEVYRNS